MRRSLEGLVSRALIVGMVAGEMNKADQGLFLCFPQLQNFSARAELSLSLGVSHSQGKSRRSGLASFMMRVG